MGSKDNIKDLQICVNKNGKIIKIDRCPFKVKVVY